MAKPTRKKATTKKATKKATKKRPARKPKPTEAEEPKPEDLIPPGSKLTPFLVGVLLRGLGLGLPVECAANLVGCSRSSIYAWRHLHPPLDQAIAKAQAEGRHRVVAKLMDAIERGSVRAMIFWLSTRAPGFQPRVAAQESFEAEFEPDERFL